MTWTDKLSRTIALYVVRMNKEFVRECDHRITGISQEIDLLRELRDELVKKDKEIERQKLEWDITFDSIIDNIVTIDNKGVIRRANKSFIDCIKSIDGPWDKLIGMSWSDLRDIVGLSSDVDTVSDCYDSLVPCEGLLTLYGKTFSVITNPIFSEEDGEFLGVVRIARDVTKQEKQKYKLQRRSDIYHAISEMSKTLVTHHNWNEAMDRILTKLGDSIGASRVYVFKNSVIDGRICSNVQHVYHNKDKRNCDVNTIVKCINYDLIPDWKSAMENGESVSGNIVDCHICSEKEKCICIGDVTVSAVPIFVDRKWWGFIGFDYMNGTRKWKDEDETLLRIAADILGGNIFHRERYFSVVDCLEECADMVDGVVK